MSKKHDDKNPFSALEQSVMAEKSLFKSEKILKMLDAASIAAKQFQKQEEMMKKLMNPLDLNNSDEPIVIGEPVINNNIPKLNIENIIPKDYTLASYKYETLMEEIKAFQEELSDDLDVMVKLVSFGESMILSIDTISYQNPDILFFYGTNNDGNPIELIQHMSQLSFLLLAVNRTNTSTPPHRIGFLADKEEGK